MDTKSLAELEYIAIEDILEAKENLQGKILRTPLVPLNVEVAGKKIYLKLENLQPVHSFKLRGAGNAIEHLSLADIRATGVYTASAGNFAQGLAWNARRLGVHCDVIVPDTTPQTKLDAIGRLGADVIKVPYETWWEVMETHSYADMTARFIHPVCDRTVIAGNATMGLEILEDLPDVDTVVCPFGGGGCVTGVASAMRALSPGVRVLACEVETAAPLAASLAAGGPTHLVHHTPSFVDGMGGKSMFPDMWRLCRGLVRGSVVLGVGEVAAAVKLLLERNRVLAEGAGAAPVAAALTDRVPPGNIVCVVSGGNIDTDRVIEILQGKVPA